MDADALKEEIKRRADLAAVISQYVPLQRSGRRLKARCPFHQEKTPSFYVDPVAGFWKCFGCGEGGDVFSFLMKIEGLSFPEAAERLAQQLGLPWERRRSDPAQTQRRRSVQAALDEARNWFRRTLASPAGAEARDYLSRRGLTDATLEEFGLGYAPPGWDHLSRHLAARGVPPTVAQEAGLIRPRQSGGHYDVFRHRVIFPIEDVTGRVLGFGGRTLDPEEDAKYLNSSDTPLFHKGQHVYGLRQARAAISETGLVVLVEGYTDVLSLHQADFAPVVAGLGTALTEDHVRLLRRYAETVVLCYDADAAGIRAALRNLEVFERLGLDAQVLTLPAGQDPDDFVRTHGLDAWQQALEQRVSLVEYQLEQVFARYRDQGPGGLTRAATQAVEVLLKVPDRVKRDFLLGRAADRWGLSDPGRTQAMQRALALELERRRPRSGRPRPASDSGRGFITDLLARQQVGIPLWRLRCEEELLRLALQEQAAGRRIFSLLNAEDFTSGAHRRLAEALCAALQTDAPCAPHELVEQLSEEEGCRSCALELLLLPEEDVSEEGIAALAAKLRRHRGVTGMSALFDELADPEPESGAPDSVEDFEVLRARVVAALESGEMAHDHPDYRRYLELCRRFKAGAPRPGSAATPAPGPLPDQSGSPPGGEGS